MNAQNGAAAFGGCHDGKNCLILVTEVFAGWIMSLCCIFTERRFRCLEAAEKQAEPVPVQSGLWNFVFFGKVQNLSLSIFA